MNKEAITFKQAFILLEEELILVNMIYNNIKLGNPTKSVALLK